AGGSEPLREAAAERRRPESHELHRRVRARQVASPPDERRPGLADAAAAIPADAGQRRQPAVLLQLLTQRQSLAKTLRFFVKCPLRYAVGNEATCTRASL